MEKRGSRKAQVLGMPFSVIFSIILIVFFIIAAIIAVKIFWNPTGCGFSDQSQEALAEQQLQDSINDAWNSDRAEFAFNLSLPGKIEYACFLDIEENAKGDYADFYNELERFSDGKYNFYLYPPRQACEGFVARSIEHVNITEITKHNNPYCVKATGGFTIIRDFYGSSLIKIK